MAFLHSRDYIHGDLRSPNVFVTEDQHLKLGDFGFARILGKAQNHLVPARLTNPRWQAPEVGQRERRGKEGEVTGRSRRVSGEGG